MLWSAFVFTVLSDEYKGFTLVTSANMFILEVGDQVLTSLTLKIMSSLHTLKYDEASRSRIEKSPAKNIAKVATVCRPAQFCVRSMNAVQQYAIKISFPLHLHRENSYMHTYFASGLSILCIYFS